MKRLLVVIVGLLIMLVVTTVWNMTTNQFIEHTPNDIDYTRTTIL